MTGPARRIAGARGLSSALAAVSVALVAASSSPPVWPRTTRSRPASRGRAKSPASSKRAAWAVMPPDGRGPMSLATYEEARPWARAIKEEVMTRRMPKWHAVRGYGDFSNDPSLSPFEIALIAAWADGGAPRGTEADASTAPHRARLERTDAPAGGRARRRAPVWRAGGAGRDPARPSGPMLEQRRVRRRLGQAAGWPARNRGLDTRLRSGVSDHLSVAGSAGSATRASGHAHRRAASCSITLTLQAPSTTNAAVTTAPRR